MCLGVCVRAHVRAHACAMCVCGSQKIMWESGPFLHHVDSRDLGYQTWQQAFVPAEPSCQLLADTLLLCEGIASQSADL